MSEGQYANVNGLSLYYEIHGMGQPLLLLHGAMSAIGTSFGKLLPSLAKSRQLIAVELQAHGHTADIDRPFDVALMADDTAALLEQIGIQRADVFGYSLGAGVALQMAIRHPERVRKLVMASVSFRNDGFHPGLLEGMQQMQPEFLTGTPWQQEYARIAPKPEDFPRLVGKIKAQFYPDLPAETIRAIKAPTLLIFGDSDIIRPEHAVEMFRLFGGGVAGDTACLPGTTHLTVVERADWLLAMITQFLDAPMPGTK